MTTGGLIHTEINFKSAPKRGDCTKNNMNIKQHACLSVGGRGEVVVGSGADGGISVYTYANLSGVGGLGRPQESREQCLQIVRYENLGRSRVVGSCSLGKRLY